MRIRLTPAAEADVRAVLDWYDGRGRDLSQQFLSALDACLEAIEQNPRSSATVHLEIRRALLRKFPYCIFYVAAEKEVVVLACLHGHRDPETWKSRRDA